MMAQSPGESSSSTHTEPSPSGEASSEAYIHFTEDAGVAYIFARFSRRGLYHITSTGKSLCKLLEIRRLPRSRRITQFEALYLLQERIVLLSRLQESPHQTAQESVRFSGAGVFQGQWREHGLESSTKGRHASGRFAEVAIRHLRCWARDSTKKRETERKHRDEPFRRSDSGKILTDGFRSAVNQVAKGTIRCDTREISSLTR